MSIHGTDHVVILVRDIDQAIARYRDGLGMTLSHTAHHADAGLRQAFFDLADGTFLELIAPADEASSLNELLDAEGEGVHVVALSVDDLDETVAGLTSRGVELIGVGSDQVLVHPRSAHGVIFQLWPRDRPHRWRVGEVGADAS